MHAAQWIRMGFYIGILLAMAGLMIRARRESLFCRQSVPIVLRPLRRSAVYLYKKWLRDPVSGGLFRRCRSVLLSEQVRSDITTMDGAGQSSRTMVIYYIDKLQMLLLCLTAGAMLGLLILLAGQRNPILRGSAIERPGYGDGDAVYRLEASSAGVSEEYDVVVSEQRYTSEETQAMFQALVEELPMLIRGANQDIAHVQSDLSLRSSYEGYPFRLRYSSSHYALVHDDGRVCNEDLEDGEQTVVTIRVKAVYKDRNYQTSIDVTVLPVERTAAGQFEDAVEDAIAAADADTVYGGAIYLPDQVEGIPVIWSEPWKDRSLALFLLILFAGSAGCIVQDRQLRERVQRRERQMIMDYPQVVSKMALFIGAGMSIRNVFYKLGEDYRITWEQGREVRYVYEEIIQMCRELDSGATEMTAYREFAGRCRLRPYTKLVSLLTQNLQKGNSTLLSALEDEASAAFEERKRIARQLGEEAGTRMLLPMMLMLIITLVIIVVPAYLGFA